MSRLACGLLQIDPSGFDTAHDFQVFLTAKISSLAQAGARLIVLPAYSAMIGPALQLESEGRSPCNPFELAGSVGTDGFSAWMDFFAAAALSNRIYLCPGTFITPDDGEFEHRAPLFSPDGNLAMVQLQTHVSEAEAQAGMVVGADLAVVDVFSHKVGISIGTDAWCPEVGRILALLGADTILAPTAVPAPYTVWRQTSGLWQIIQQNQVFGIEASLAGRWLGTTYQGRSRVFGPVEVTPDGRGVLGEVTSESIEGEMIASLDLADLQTARRAFPIFEHFNIGLYEARLADAYLVGHPARVRSEGRQ
ncbi:MAG TPA: nitrilase-related carbon-nitrogen hydrolase [Bacillota bacterium]|nr:nitrilase-related carbon-nitrogen hydrolase [Bacillota bacterium]